MSSQTTIGHIGGKCLFFCLSYYNYHSAMESKSTIESVFVNWTSCTTNYEVPSPLITAIKKNPWEGVTEDIFKANPDVVQDIDETTTLMPFMIAAVGEDSDLDSIFSLLIAYPVAINAGNKITVTVQ